VKTLEGTTLDTSLARNWITEIARLVEEQKDYLTGLDAAIGDGDHGVNLHRGFSAATVALAEKNPTSPGEVISTVGNTLVSKVGGASGPLYGTAFRRAGKALGREPEVSTALLAEAIQAALGGVRELGAAELGDKTMVDALTPAAEAFSSAAAGGASLKDAASAAYEAASKGAEATIPLQAQKGRASYLGPRSVGHQDPGATSSALIFFALLGAVGA
jgi:phosphoenolpyruvate---glycerone phosphotransferase subunit DhaL